MKTRQVDIQKRETTTKTTYKQTNKPITITMKFITILLFAIAIVATTAKPPIALRGSDYCEIDGACTRCTSCLALSGKFCTKKSRSPKNSASFAIVSGPYCLDPASNNQVCDEGEPLESCESLEGLSTIMMPGMQLPKTGPTRLFRL